MSDKTYIPYQRLTNSGLLDRNAPIGDSPRSQRSTRRNNVPVEHTVVQATAAADVEPGPSLTNQRRGRIPQVSTSNNLVPGGANRNEENTVILYL